MQIVIPRLYKYREVLTRFRSLGLMRIFSEDLANAVGATSVQVRKDFSNFGITGHKRGGYRIDQLVDQLDDLLGKKIVQRVILVGVGNIGRALLDYEGFQKEGIVIEAAFDIDRMKVGTGRKTLILPIEEMVGYIKRNKIKIAVIAVPYACAQQVFDELVSAGIKGVLNFAPVNLKVPEDCFVNNMDVRLELETVGYYVRAIESKKTTVRKISRVHLKKGASHGRSARKSFSQNG